MDTINIKNLAAEIAAEIKPKRYYYGYAGIQQIFGCSWATAARIVARGDIDESISRIGRKILIDGDRALEINALKNKNRR